MSLEDNKALTRRALELWTTASADTAEDVLATTYVNHQEPDVKCDVAALDLPGWKKLVEAHRAAFPDLRVRILTQVAEGDMVATRWEFTTTHTGAYLGVAPSGSKLTWTGIEIDRVENGRIAESWIDWDKYRFLQGLGLVG
jgi:predicted ester cyclase